jgi:hypothetical protein
MASDVEELYIRLLIQAYPYLVKRKEENPDPELVGLVDKIETLMHIVYGDYA